MKGLGSLDKAFNSCANAEELALSKPDLSMISSRKSAEVLAKFVFLVAHPEDIAVGGGFKDWFIEKFHRPAFTLEIGKGVNPLSPDVFDTEYPLVSNMLWYLLAYK